MFNAGKSTSQFVRGLPLHLVLQFLREVSQELLHHRCCGSYISLTAGHCDSVDPAGPYHDYPASCDFPPTAPRAEYAAHVDGLGRPCGGRLDSSGAMRDEVRGVRSYRSWDRGIHVLGGSTRPSGVSKAHFISNRDFLPPDGRARSS